MSTGIPQAHITLTTHSEYGGLITCHIDINKASPDDWAFLRRFIAVFLRHQDPVSQ